MKTLYDDLEVSKSASKEVIEKTYKVLAKKYHPDLQETAEEKKKAQEKMVKINAAYEILGDEEKKKEYDRTLEEEQAQIEINKAVNNTNNMQNRAAKVVDNFNNTVNSVYSKLDPDMAERIRQQAYVDAQNDYNRAYVNRYYNTFQKIRYNWNFIKTLKLLLIIGIINTIVAILFMIPDIRNGMINFYETSRIIKIFINIIEFLCNAIANLLIGVVRNIRGF